ncbi:MAG TPA: cytochrome c oxidase subunit II transmembrane domain-containing protein, partial [Planctomycetota bacterium]|nr:cytochrome c oxidase subunit II transmembrane domain-containing protein [Planctomycetota bacterium]
MNEIQLMPPQASSHAIHVDQLYFYIWGICGFFILLIAGLIVYFSIKYHRRPGNEVGSRVHAGVLLEIVWTVVPLVLAMTMFVWGARLYMAAYRIPEDAMEIHVVGRQWMWKMQHPQGRREINELHVPTGRSISLMMTSQDVIHSFFVPAFRVKHDVLPGRYTRVWFKATKPGTYH